MNVVLRAAQPFLLTIDDIKHAEEGGRDHDGNERTLVLGGGGRVGTAWMAGLVGGLQRQGIDLGQADRIIGTSAGAIVGAALAVGEGLDHFARLGPADGRTATPP